MDVLTMCEIFAAKDTSSNVSSCDVSLDKVRHLVNALAAITRMESLLGGRYQDGNGR